MRNYGRRKRTIPVRGEPVEPYENEKLYKCWYCGHINTTGRDRVNDGEMSIKLTDFVRKSNGVQDAMTMGKEASYSICRSPKYFYPVLRLKQNGDPVTTYHNFTVADYGHCAGCGTVTWSG